MTEQDKEFIKVLVAGMTEAFHNASANYASKEDLKEELGKYATKIDLKNEIRESEERTKSELRKEMKEMKQEIFQAMTENTNKILTVLDKYSYITEKHDRALNKLKDELDQDK